MNALPWLGARVLATRDLSPTVREITLDPPAGVPRWSVGSHLRVRVSLPGGQPGERRYSLVGLPGPAGDPWRIAVKRVEASRGGSQYMWTLREGDVLAVQAPANHFELPPQPRPTLLVAGGIGITPMLGMAQALARRGSDVRMAYAVRQPGDAVYADALRDTLGERLSLHVSSRAERFDARAQIAALPADAQLLACGPVRLLHALQAAWTEAGRAPQRLRFETFGTSGELPAEPFWVEVPRHGLRFEVAAGQSLLDALEAHGIACLADCLRGECGLCAVDVIAVHGRIDHRDVYMTPHEQRENKRMCACVSRVAGGGVVIDSAWRPDAI
jgi:vanillate O-demethylase ferredoxin subunit